MVTRKFAVIPINDGNPWPTWQSMALDPESLTKEIASRLMIQADEMSESIFISDDTPPQGEREKLWIKTSWPYGIGKLIAGKYRMDYGMSGFPVNVPFLRSDKSFGTSLPPSLRKLTPEEVLMRGLPRLQDPEGQTTDRHSYYIFSPAEVNI